MSTTTNEQAGGQVQAGVAPAAGAGVGAGALAAVAAAAAEATAATTPTLLILIFCTYYTKPSHQASVSYIYLNVYISTNMTKDNHG
jgi:hypothetical protein